MRIFVAKELYRMYNTGFSMDYIQNTRSMMRVLESSIKNHWEAPALSDYATDVSFTFHELALQISKMHQFFKNQGIEMGDKIAICDKNSSYWGVTLLSVMTYGAVAVPILADFNGEQIVNITHHSDAKMLFCGQQMKRKITSALEGEDDPRLKDCQIVDICKVGEKVTDWDITPEEVRYFDDTPEGLAIINYTSGSTGNSKGVMLPYRCIWSNIAFADEKLGLKEHCNILSLLPMAHMYGFSFEFVYELCMGGHIHFLTKAPSPTVLAKALSDIKPDVVICVPLIVEKIYKKQIAPQIAKPPVSWVMKVPFLDEVVLGKIRQQLINAFGGEFKQLVLGGAPLNSEVEAFFRRIKFPLTVGYGMTECAPLITVSFYPEVRTYSCGKILEGYMEMRIADPNEEGIGEIQVRGENLMYGYYRNAQATADTFTQDGWLKTGDLGYIDKDGFLFIKGRNKSMLLGANGQNIYPEEIETKLNNMPYVLESLVIQQKDGSLVALVCPDYDAVDAVGLDHEALDEAMEKNRRDLNGQIAAYEQINKIKLFPHEFEKTPKKSIKRFLYTSLEEA